MSGGVSCYDGVIRKGAGDHGAGANNYTIAEYNPFEDNRIRSDKHIITKSHRFAEALAAILRCATHAGIEGMEVMIVDPDIAAKHDMIADINLSARGKDGGGCAKVVADVDSALIHGGDEAWAGHADTIGAPVGEQGGVAADLNGPGMSCLESAGP